MNINMNKDLCMPGMERFKFQQSNVFLKMKFKHCTLSLNENVLNRTQSTQINCQCMLATIHL
jgi:hypothetical protein